MLRHYTCPAARATSVAHTLRSESEISNAVVGAVRPAAGSVATAIHHGPPSTPAGSGGVAPASLPGTQAMESLPGQGPRDYQGREHPDPNAHSDPAEQPMRPHLRISSVVVTAFIASMASAVRFASMRSEARATASSIASTIFGLPAAASI